MKSVAVYRPISIERALDDFDRYIESFFGESPMAPAGRRVGCAPAVDVKENEDVYLLEAELPGYEEQDVQVHVDGRTLTIESKKEEKTEKEEDKFILRERRNESFSRSFRLPENADTESISAAFKNGLLRLEINKKAEAKKRVIEISGK